MSIKPLEKKTVRGVFPKLFFLSTLLIAGLLINFFVSKQKPKIKFETQKPSVLGISQIITGPEKLINDSIKNAEETTNQIIISANNMVSSIANDSTKVVSNFVFDNTFKKIIDQIKVLPKDQQEKIKQEICR